MSVHDAAEKAFISSLTHEFSDVCIIPKWEKVSASTFATAEFADLSETGSHERHGNQCQKNESKSKL